jgi:hypothetical protein
VRMGPADHRPPTAGPRPACPRQSLARPRIADRSAGYVGRGRPTGHAP